MTASNSNTGRAGVLVVDKPTGLTSHDVVNRVRRAFGLRRVGHAGTLDPLASGVLVVMVGAATKLAPYLSGDDKSYRATVWLGLATDTLDAEGTPTQQADLPAWFFDGEQSRTKLSEALQAERTRTEQLPPAHSAVKVAGQRAYARARAGQPVALQPRPVGVHQLELLHHRPVPDPGEPLPLANAPTIRGEVHLMLRVTSGYYVRALARDLGAHLGLPAHLRALRRTASGPFDLAQANPLCEGLEALRASLIPLATAAQMVLPAAVLTPQGCYRARQGQPLELADFSSVPPPGRAAAWLDGAGQLVAVGELLANGHARVRRGFGR